MEYEVTNCVNAEEINQCISVKNVTFGLGHLSIALQQPWMTKYLLRKRNIQSHQEDRPVNGMEADDIFTDQMKICRPVFLVHIIMVAITVITNTCDIVCKCIKPYVCDMLRIEVNRNAPCEGCSGNAEVL